MGQKNQNSKMQQTPTGPKVYISTRQYDASWQEIDVPLMQVIALGMPVVSSKHKYDGEEEDDMRVIMSPTTYRLANVLTKENGADGPIQGELYQ